MWRRRHNKIVDSAAVARVRIGNTFVEECNDCFNNIRTHHILFPHQLTTRVCPAWVVTKLWILTMQKVPFSDMRPACVLRDNDLSSILANVVALDMCLLCRRIDLLPEPNRRAYGRSQALLRARWIGVVWWRRLLLHILALRRIRRWQRRVKERFYAPNGAFVRIAAQRHRGHFKPHAKQSVRPKYLSRLWNRRVLPRRTP